MAAGKPVGAAARAAGMSRRSAYNLRNRAESATLPGAWDAAQCLARRQLTDSLMSRAIHGVVVPVIRNGKVWGERHRFDNRLSMAMLTRLDRHVRSQGADVDLVGSFDHFVETACADMADALGKRGAGGAKPVSNGNRASCELNRGKNPPRDGEGDQPKAGGGAALRSAEPKSLGGKLNTRFRGIDENDKAPKSPPGLTPHIPTFHHRAYA